ncbi:hypothetical protein [Parashewanella tropica]|uniref:hypothetical protein n=1 Tax=Parashewanella tropica TaxID=2547970 RepID=UPI001059EF6B|nr:hypothetical protein [Parashewanella tropica]
MIYFNSYLSVPERECNRIDTILANPTTARVNHQFTVKGKFQNKDCIVTFQNGKPFCIKDKSFKKLDVKTCSTEHALIQFIHKRIALRNRPQNQMLDFDWEEVWSSPLDTKNTMKVFMLKDLSS